jgi:hypothetical protein
MTCPTCRSEDLHRSRGRGIYERICLFVLGCGDPRGRFKTDILNLGQFWSMRLPISGRVGRQTEHPSSLLVHSISEVPNLTLTCPHRLISTPVNVRIHPQAIQ